MPLFRRRRWKPPQPRCSFLVGCASAERLPPLEAVAHPEAAGGALPAFVVQHTAAGPRRDVADLERPLRLGDDFVVATPARGMWRLQVRVADAAMRPDREIWPYLGLDDELGERLAASRVDVHVQRLDGSEAPAAEDVLYGTQLVDGLAAVAEGAVLDVEAYRAFGPGGWRVPEPVGLLDPREHVSIHSVGDDGGTWLHTHGLVKFGRPEVELYDVPDDLVDGVAGRINDLALYVMNGALVQPGETVGDIDAPLRALEGGRDREHWADTVVLELVGAEGDRGAERALRAWVELG